MTEYGAARILAGVDQLRATMRQVGDHQRLRFVIGVVGSIVHGTLPALLRRFREHRLAAAPDGGLRLTDTAGETLIAYLSEPRPSFAGEVLRLLRNHGVAPARVMEVREVGTALGLVAAQSGIAVVPLSMRHLRRDDLVYRRLADEDASSPIILSLRLDDERAIVATFARLASDNYGRDVS